MRAVVVVAVFVLLGVAVALFARGIAGPQINPYAVVDSVTAAVGQGGAGYILTFRVQTTDGRTFPYSIEVQVTETTSEINSAIQEAVADKLNTPDQYVTVLGGATAGY